MTYLELAIKYNLAYAFWGFLDYHFCYSWLGEIAQRQMNKISKKKYGKTVYSMPEDYKLKQRRNKRI